MLSAIVGLLIALGGLWGVVHWWTDFVSVLRGILPIGFFLGGVIAVVAGLSSLKKAPPESPKVGEDKKPI